MQTALEGRGFVTLNQDYASRRKALEALAEDIHPAIERFADGVDGSVHFVGHSMGGLLARVYLRYISQNAWAASSCSARRTAAAKSPIA